MQRGGEQDGGLFKTTIQYGKLSPIPDASHTRNRKISPPDSHCLPGTRRQVIQDTIAWADSKTIPDDGGGHVLWLYGHVGCGKSAIAQAVAEEFAKRKRLAGSFFFFRGSGDRSRTRRFAATIASQMMTAIPSTASFVKAALKAQPNLPTLPLDIQFQYLVFEPLLSASKRLLSIEFRRGPLLIVVDGVDECEDREEVSDWITDMLEYMKEHPRIPLRLFIASRVEAHIRTRLETSQVLLVNLVDHVATNDIAIVMRQTFDEAAKYNQVIKAYGRQWPTPADLLKLVEHTGGSFIFMATILRFILASGQGDSLPMERLPCALMIDPGLDGLYMQTLATARDRSHFSEIISTIAFLQDSLSINGLSDLLNIPRHEVVHVLVPLQSIIQVPGDDRTPIALCHSSLHNFLNTESRSGPFHAHHRHHLRIVQCCNQCLRRSTTSEFEFETEAAIYARRFMPSHWEAFLENSLKDFPNVQSQAEQLVSIIGDGDLILSTYFIVRQRVEAGVYGLAIATAEVLEGLVEDPMNRPVLHLHAKLLEILISGSSIDSSAVQQHLQRLEPTITGPSHRTDLVEQGYRFLVRSGFWRLTAEPRSSRLQHPKTNEFLIEFWLQDLAYAVEHDPDFDLARLQKKSEFWYGLHPDTSCAVEYPWPPHESDRQEPWEMSIPSSVEQVISAIEEKFSSTVFSKLTFDWHETAPKRKWVFAYQEGNYTFSMLDLVHGFKQLSLCYNGGCQHTRPPCRWPPPDAIEGRSRPRPSPRHVILVEEDIRRLFQECKLAQGNALLLTEAILSCRRKRVKASAIIEEFLPKCRIVQELIWSQIAWATASAERSRLARDAEQCRKHHEDDETTEEKLLGNLLASNADLLEALRQYDDFIHELEEAPPSHTDAPSQLGVNVQDSAESSLPPPPNQQRGQSESIPAPLTALIGFLTATGLDDPALILELCDRASASEVNAKEAARAIYREFKYAEPSSQLSAARLWAIMLRNSSHLFIDQCRSKRFLNTVEDVLYSGRTTPVVRDRILEVLGAAAYADQPMPISAFRKLWQRVKPTGKPDEGVPFDDEEFFNTSVPTLHSQFKPPIHVKVGLGPRQQEQKEERVDAPSPPKLDVTRNRIITQEEDIHRLFQECKIGQGNASLLLQALATPSTHQSDDIVEEFYSKCCSSQELIFAQIPWASAMAERSRQELEVKNGSHANEETVQEQLLTALIASNAQLSEALRDYDEAAA